MPNSETACLFYYVNSYDSLVPIFQLENCDMATPKTLLVPVTNFYLLGRYNTYSYKDLRFIPKFKVRWPVESS